jgi:hypothetical protein
MSASYRPLNDYFKVIVLLERRSDGGLRAYSDDVPGFVLSHFDPNAVVADIKPSLERILSHMLDGKVVVEELPRLREKMTHTEMALPDESPIARPIREYVTHLAAGASA